MYYLESEKIKKNPELYQGIETSVSWILRESFIYEYFGKFDRGAAILEIGPGSGYLLDRLDKMGFTNLRGADLGNYLKNKKHPLQIVDLNVEKLDLPDESMDVVMAFQVLEHLENYFLILHEVARVLKPGGFFIFSAPNPFNIFYRIKFALTGNMTGWTLGNNHLLFLTRDVFTKTYLRDFNLVKKYYGRGPIPMLGRLNFIPGVNFPARVRVLPRYELLADRVCCFLRRKHNANDAKYSIDSARNL